MQLEEFIASTLAQIVRGVKRAQEETIDDYGPWVSPVGRKMPPLPDMALLPMGNNEQVYLQNVGFDVAITASDKVEGDTKGGVRVLGVGLSGGASVENKNTSASRVQFNVPLVLPGLRVVPREGRLDADDKRYSDNMDRLNQELASRGPRYG
jgi:hypothetical protein